ncbi:unnamed protein product [Paramecium pentaurelia]|uniref:Uncharacterized protein n=1 Tax=Paramecium pentaurelia TaxID=43138 RepID=A0A8S1U575_9CILI|nr:unnamed protein product [Paramecium pentaurelia]
MSNPIVLEQSIEEIMDQTKINELVNRFYNQTQIPKKLKFQNDSSQIQGLQDVVTMKNWLYIILLGNFIQY